MLTSGSPHFFHIILILQLLHRKNQCQSVLESPDIILGDPVDKRLYLASNSPRRIELLKILGWEYNHLPVLVDETPLPDEDGAVYVRRISASKVASAAQQAGGNGVIIAADTAVIDSKVDGKTVILGKPDDPQIAGEMLRSLRGHTHQVITAISLLRLLDGVMLGDYCVSDVPMRNYSDGEIQEYVDSGDPLDKAGAYAIQHSGFHPVESLKGCYANVMGLPLCHLSRCLLRFGMRPRVDVAATCQAALKYDCPVYREILSDQNWDDSPI
jgi:septum formation protein